MFHLITSQFGHLADMKCPISDISIKNGFKVVEPITEDEFFRSELVCGDDKYVLSVVSHNHDRTNQLRPDTVHNTIYHYKNGKLHEKESYMYVEDDL